MICNVCGRPVHPGWVGLRCEDCDVNEWQRLRIRGFNRRLCDGLLIDGDGPIRRGRAPRITRAETT